MEKMKKSCSLVLVIQSEPGLCCSMNYCERVQILWTRNPVEMLAFLNRLLNKFQTFCTNYKTAKCWMGKTDPNKFTRNLTAFLSKTLFQNVFRINHSKEHQSRRYFMHSGKFLHFKEEKRKKKNPEILLKSIRPTRTRKGFETQSKNSLNSFTCSQK